jgi:hypothetical protein
VVAFRGGSGVAVVADGRSAPEAWCKGEEVRKDDYSKKKRTWR